MYVCDWNCTYPRQFDCWQNSAAARGQMMLGCRSDLRISLVDGKLGKLLAIKGPLFIHMSYVVRYHSEVHDCMPMYPLLYLYIINMIINDNDTSKEQ